MVEWKLWEILFSLGKERKTICYGKLLNSLGLELNRKNVKKLTFTLHKVCTYAYLNWKVFPGSVVVLKATQKPSKGYFKFLKTLKPYGNWEEEKRRFYEFCSKF